MSAPAERLPELRALLFVPADDERKAEKALSTDADAVILDLEDAVDRSQKNMARANLPRLLPQAGAKPVLVRVNHVESELEHDLDALEGLPIRGVVFPKATPATLAALPTDGPPVIALVETASGIYAAEEIAIAHRVAALMLGTIDLSLELRLLRRGDGQELLLARSRLVLASALAGIQPPIDGVYPFISDNQGLRNETELARSLGMGGKACVHPQQLEIVRNVFADEADVEWARAVVTAYDRAQREGRGVVAVEGEMVDLPVLERARHLLAKRTENAPHTDLRR